VGRATLAKPAQNFQAMSDMNPSFLTLCTFKLGVLWYVSIEGSAAVANFSVLLKGKLRTDRRWDLEDGTSDNT